MYLYSIPNYLIYYYLAHVNKEMGSSWYLLTDLSIYRIIRIGGSYDAKNCRKADDTLVGSSLFR